MVVESDERAERERRIKAIMDFVSDHRESLASLVICRRALGEAVPRVNGQLIQQLGDYLQHANDEELASYYDFVL